MHTYIQYLTTTADFLALTCQHPNGLPTFSFQLNNNVTTDQQNTHKQTSDHHNTDKTINVTVLNTGIIFFEPSVKANNVKNIMISCGIHGNETAPIEICQQLIKNILTGQLAVQHRLLIIIANPAAINLQKRFVNENLNTLFSKSVSALNAASYEAQRVQVIEQAVTTFYQQAAPCSANIHYDLHTAIRDSVYEKFAICPYLHEAQCSTQQLNFLTACGVQALLFFNAPTHAFSYFSFSQFSAHGFTIELGKVKPFGENNMAEFTQVIEQLTRLINNEPQPMANLQQLTTPANKLVLFNVAQTIVKQSAAFNFNFANEQANFSTFPNGYLLANDGDKTYCIKQQGEAILFPNEHVAIGQRALLTVQPIT